MILPEPKNAENLYEVFKPILIEQHEPDLNHGWGSVTIKGKGFYLKLRGDYKTEGLRTPVEIEHPDKYFLSKFHMDESRYTPKYLDRIISMSFSKDKRGQRREWITIIPQHLEQAHE